VLSPAALMHALNQLPSVIEQSGAGSTSSFEDDMDEEDDDEEDEEDDDMDDGLRISSQCQFLVWNIFVIADVPR